MITFIIVTGFAVGIYLGYQKKHPRKTSV